MEPIYFTNDGTGVALACTDSSGSTRVALVGDGDCLVVTNVGVFIGYLALGDNTITAVAPGSTASYPVLVHTKEDQIIIDKDSPFHAAPYVAGVCKTGESTTLIVHRVRR